MMKKLFTLWYHFQLVVLLATSHTASAVPVSLEGLKNKYANLESLQAEIDQTKKSRFLFKPLKSQVKLTYSKKELRWEMVSPFSQIVLVRDNALVTKSTESAKEEITPIVQGSKLHYLSLFFRALFSMDLKVLEKQFTLSFAGQVMTALPQKNSELSFIKEMTFVFDDDLRLDRVKVSAQEEETELQFRSLKTFATSLPKAMP
jgi:outer membrane lipoprotein-sorting protein